MIVKMTILASVQENLCSRICEKQRHRQPCASAQSDQRLSYSLSKLATSKISIFYHVVEAEQAGLDMTCSETTEDRFSRVKAHMGPSQKF